MRQGKNRMNISPENSRKFIDLGLFLDNGAKILGKGIIGHHCRLWANVGLINSSIGAYSYTVSTLAQTTCGNYSSIAHLVNFATPHPVNRLTTSPLTCFDPQADNLFHDFGIKTEFDLYPPIKIGSDVWVGTNTAIKCGITIHDGAIVGAGAVVTKDVPPFAIVGGVPAKILRMRFSAPVIDRIMRIKWYNYDWAGFELEWPDPQKALDAMERHIDENKARPLKFYEYAANDASMQLREIQYGEGLARLAMER